MERDITMKRHLIEDLKFRQKVNLESNEGINEMLENLEKRYQFLFIDTKNITCPCIYFLNANIQS